MTTPETPKTSTWTADDQAHLEKVAATFPPMNAAQIAVCRRTFGKAAQRLAELKEQESHGRSED